MNDSFWQRLKLSGNQDASEFPDSSRGGKKILKLMDTAFFVEGRPGNAEQLGRFAHVATVQAQGLRQHFFLITFQFG